MAAKATVMHTSGARFSEALGMESTAVAAEESAAAHYASKSDTAWFARVLTQRSRKSDDETVESQTALLAEMDSHTTSTSTAVSSPTASVHETESLLKEELRAPLPSSQLSVSPAETTAAGQRKPRFGFSRRKAPSAGVPVAEVAAPPRKTSAAYVPQHAGSDFGGLALPTTYQESYMYTRRSSLASSYKTAHGGVHQLPRRQSQQARTADRHRHSSASSSYGRSLSYSSLSSPSDSSGSHSGSISRSRSPTQLDPGSRQSLVFVMTEEEEDEHVDNGGEVCGAEATAANDRRQALHRRAESMSRPPQQRRPKTQIVFAVPEYNARRQSHNYNDDEEGAHAPGSGSLSPTLSRRSSEQAASPHHQRAGRAAKARIGQKFSEYLKPTIVPEHKTPTPHFSVSRADAFRNDHLDEER